MTLAGGQSGSSPDSCGGHGAAVLGSCCSKENLRPLSGTNWVFGGP